ncbi:guanylate kinase [Alysiella crassa]|uniref:Guanylate kinase n=1 Tax=Alysiella crassa TaxID=153491 RepID=A0A376BN49_9NEIS|nr:guanylate kinase [Alysiella crassa]SSY71088.1 Guanylate kinase [Alysiella crassa]
MTTRTGNVFIISAASGTGKTTLVSRLVKNHADIRVSVSHTTRAPRENEQHGKHYYFVSQEKFMDLVGQGAFLEHAEVFGNYYGTSVMGVEELTRQGFDVILEIDVQGAAQIRETLPHAIGIFILPPSLAILEERLRKRETDSAEVIERRLAEAKSEIEQASAFDYVVVNDDLIATEMNLLHIIRSQLFRQPLQRATIEKVLQNS